MDVSISAVIPTHDRGALVERAVHSVLEQSYSPREIIVVDDGSTDDTKPRVEAFGSKVKYFYQQNSGAAAARNTAVRLATADWVAFLDSDDLWSPNHLEKIATAISDTSGAALFYFADTDMASAKGRSGSLWKKIGFKPDSPYEFKEDGTEWAMLPLQPMMLQSSVFRRKALLERNGLWEELSARDDTHLFFSFSFGDPICAVADCGSIMTNDDATARLTVKYNSHTRSYWRDTVLMYGDLLRRARNIPRKVRAHLRRRKTDGHWRIAKIALHQRDLFTVSREVFAIAATEPTFFCRRPLASIARRLSVERRRAR